MQDFDSKLNSFVVGAQAIIAADFGRNYPNLPVPTLEINEGPRYVRIVRREQNGDGSAHCFIDRKNGNVLKSASWKSPAKHARGNIFDDKNGLGAMGPHGAAYLR